MKKITALVAGMFFAMGIAVMPPVASADVYEFEDGTTLETDGTEEVGDVIVDQYGNEYEVVEG